MRAAVPVILVASFLAVLLSPQLARSADPVAWQQSVQLAVQQSAETRRPLLMVFTSASCIFCKKLYQETLTNAHVSDQINRGFVPVLLDQQSAGALASQLQIQAFPTTVIVSPEGRLVDRIDGYLAPREFHSRLYNAHRASSLLGQRQ